MTIVMLVAAANDSLDSAAEDDLLESETNTKGQPFFVKKWSMIRRYLGSQASRDPSPRKSQVKSNTLTCAAGYNGCVPNQIAGKV